MKQLHVLGVMLAVLVAGGGGRGVGRACGRGKCPAQRRGEA